MLFHLPLFIVFHHQLMTGPKILLIRNNNTFDKVTGRLNKDKTNQPVGYL